MVGSHHTAHILAWLVLLPALCHGIQLQPLQNVLQSQQTQLVPVVLGVMSRCPDAILCEGVIDKVLKQVRHKVDLSLTFLAKIDKSEPYYGVTCMHGPGECAGNIQELCAMKYEPLIHWWEFVQCQNFHGRYEIGNPEVALECAQVAGIDWQNSGTGRCAGLDGTGHGEEGVALLKQSVKASQSLRIRKSCTIIINGKQVCVHDGEWKDCEAGHRPEDFVRQINDEFERLNSRCNM